MPNFCHNTLIVKGDSYETLERFYQDNYKNDDEPLSFENLVPIVIDEEDDNTLNHLECSEMWGTKWNARDFGTTTFDDHENYNTLTYDFYTAWSPPNIWLHKVAPLYPDLSFELEYHESGADFWGKQIYENGLMIKEECESLGERNWRLCDKAILKKVIDDNMFLITKENYTLRIDNIVDDYAFEADYSDNLHTFVERIVEHRLGLVPMSYKSPL